MPPLTPIRLAEKVTATATVKLKDAKSGEDWMEAAIGVGPVDATFKAIARMVKRPVLLTHYNITKIHGGSAEQAAGNDALASVVLHVQERGGESAPALPDDFPGHHGAVYRSDGDDHMPKKSKPGKTACQKWTPLLLVTSSQIRR